MKINVIRGTHQFGGNAVKVTSDSGSAIVLDFGNHCAKGVNVCHGEDGVTLAAKVGKYSALFCFLRIFF